MKPTADLKKANEEIEYLRELNQQLRLENEFLRNELEETRHTAVESIQDYKNIAAMHFEKVESLQNTLQTIGQLIDFHVDTKYAAKYEK